MNGSVIPLADATEPDRHGGKAASLASLAAAGLPVLDGLVVPADLPDQDLAVVVRAILNWPASRAGTGLICRSSAPSEDGHHHSFAGQFTSKFTPATPPELLTALTTVRASATSATVTNYADTHHCLRPTDVVVLVQPALRPYAAGVVAAELPHGALARWRIEAVHGLALPLVDGTATGEIHLPGQPALPAVQPALMLPATSRELAMPPGEWITIPERAGYDTPLKIATSGDGLLTLRLPARPPAVLLTEDRDALLDLAVAAARVLGLDRVDIEWTITPDGVITLVQARALTRPLPPARPTPSDGSWVGIPAAPGRATGPSVVLRPGTLAHRIRGSVILCTNIGADAADALLQEPVAIASTTGGPLSHAAIVARELSIPCVTSLPEQLPQLLDGMFLDVDGDAGTVSFANDDHAATIDNHCPTTAESVLAVRPADLHLLPAGSRAALVTDASVDPGVLAQLRSDQSCGLLHIGRTPGPIPDGYTAHRITDFGHLIWPDDLTPVPRWLVVADQNFVVWQQAIVPPKHAPLTAS